MTKSLLFLLSLCLLPFLSFSSTNFTSENPIVLPTDGVKIIGQSVFDNLGRAVEPRRNYRIHSNLGGVLNGQVFLDFTPNSRAPCPDGVFQLPASGRGTPVRFIEYARRGNPPRIFENQDINIQFIGSRNCDNYTPWKVEPYDASLEASLLGTNGGTIGQRDSSWFKIRNVARGSYHLLSCPGPFECPNCPDDDRCQVVWVVMQNGKRRLALARRQTPPQELRFPLRVHFVRA